MFQVNEVFLADNATLQPLEVPPLPLVYVFLMKAFYVNSLTRCMGELSDMCSFRFVAWCCITHEHASNMEEPVVSPSDA